MDTRQIQGDLLALAVESPVASTDTLEYVREYDLVGEVELALETLSSRIYEDELPITRDFYTEMLSVAIHLGVTASVEQLKPQIILKLTSN